MRITVVCTAFVSADLTAYYFMGSNARNMLPLRVICQAIFLTIGNYFLLRSIRRLASAKNVEKVGLLL